MQSYQHWFGEGSELAVLRMLGLFDRPADEQALECLRKPPAIPGLTEELMAVCKKTLAPYKYPRWVEYVPELPKTATGKIQRFKLRS